jgi:hypothetical protein
VTIRSFLTSRFRRLMLLGILAWLACAGAGFAASARLVPQWIAFIPFTAFAVVVILVLLWIRCPRCGSPLGQNAGFLNSKDRFYQKRVNFCSHCGVNFDEPYSVALTVGSSESRAASSVSQGGGR